MRTGGISCTYLLESIIINDKCYCYYLLLLFWQYKAFVKFKILFHVDIKDF